MKKSMPAAINPSSQNSSKKQTATNILQTHFPNIRKREEIRKIIAENPALNSLFMTWKLSFQEDFLACCSGERGMKILYDGVFKEIFNPEYTPQRLSSLLSLIFSRNVTIKEILPNDSVRLGEESSLLYTDIIVQLQDESLANVEIQKIGYAFPGERCACYSANHLLRQYKRVRGKKGKNFTYQQVKQVYTIIFFERSPEIFHAFPNHWLHKFRQQSDTGITMELLQEYYFIPLDIFQKNMHNKGINTSFEAWLTFLSSTSPERIEELITHFPEFKLMYQEIYDLCLNTERVMNMYSKELQILDQNTVHYMIDELQEQVDKSKMIITQKEQLLFQKDQILSQKDQEIRALKAQIEKLQK